MSEAAVSPDSTWWRQLSLGLAELGSVKGALHAVGRLLAPLASWLLLAQVLLMARIPFLERGFGQDQIVRAHRWAGFVSFDLVLAHLVVTTTGYAAWTGLGPWGTLVDFVVSYPGLLLAVTGFVALCLVVVSSLRRARSRLRYESWQGHGRGQAFASGVPYGVVAWPKWFLPQQTSPPAALTAQV